MEKRALRPSWAFCNMQAIPLLHFCITTFMCGIIWLIQLVHYPSFHFIDKKDFVHFEFFHTKWISFIVMPAMILEITLQLYLVWKSPTQNYMITTSLLIIIWLTTFLFSVPAHNKLSNAKDESLIDKLIHTNWIRTFCWTARMFILFSVLV